MSESGRRTISSSTSAEESEDPRPTEESSHVARHRGSLPPRASSAKAPSPRAAAEQKAPPRSSVLYYDHQIVPAQFKLLAPEQEASGDPSEARRRNTGGVRRFEKARLKEYVVLRALEQAALVKMVLQRVEQLKEENRDMKFILQRLVNIEAGVKDLQSTSARPQPRGVSAPNSTYAETVKKAITVAAASTTSRAREGTVVISAPDEITPEKIQEKLKKAVNPAENGWQIVNRKVSGNSKLALNTAIKEQAKALAEHPKLK